MFHDVMVWTKLSMARVVLASVIKKKKKKKDLTVSQFFFWYVFQSSGFFHSFCPSVKTSAFLQISSIGSTSNMILVCFDIKLILTLQCRYN